ncbi:MAG: sensor domain-containing diguanylate cyclase [Desulfuromonadales bacterium]|nr:sensor domain-containing diguanylate cyclase [Desulfuromonadales bacterium]
MDFEHEISSINKSAFDEAAVSAIVKIAQLLASSKNIEEIFERVSFYIKGLLNPDLWVLFLREGEKDEMKPVLIASHGSENVEDIRVSFGEGFAGWVAENGKSLIVKDVNKDERLTDVYSKLFPTVKGTLLSVPIKVYDDIFGVIELASDSKQYTFNNYDKRLLEIIADFSGIAISNIRSKEKVENLVITDDLTGLYNSRYFYEQIEYEIERSKRSNFPLSLIFFDLDNFKKVNDSYGHLVGSRFLKEIGIVVQQNIRKTDKASRYGGDEFVLILPETDKKGAVILANKLCNAVREFTFDIGKLEHIGLTASFGIATFPDDADSIIDLIGTADKEMYKVKYSGRNGVSFIVDEQGKKSRH